MARENQPERREATAAPQPREARPESAPAAASPLGTHRRGFLTGAAATLASALGARQARAGYYGYPGSYRGGQRPHPFPDLNRRRVKAFRLRLRAAYDEYFRPLPHHRNNGDEERFPSRIGNFSKTLPHNEMTGEVDPAAYQALLDALRSEDLAQLETVPGIQTLANPLGGLFCAIEGPDPSAISVKPPSADSTCVSSTAPRS